ncbi:MAG: hypothetical protein QF535_16610 [Anaerolineales bacterium]|jgi:hypothetical protein|nr:hypothetical protein [Anaerolineales bacterium]
MDCTLKISTYTTDASSAVEWYSKEANVKVDGGTTSKWLAYESFVKMIGAAANEVPLGTGHP